MPATEHEDEEGPDRHPRDEAYWAHVAVALGLKVREALQRRFHVDRSAASVLDAMESAIRTAIRRDNKGKLKIERLHHLEGWLVVVAGRKLQRQWKKTHREKQAPLTEVNGRVDPAPTPLDQALVNEASELIEELHGALTSEQRLVLRGRLQEQTENQIADAIERATGRGVTTRTVRRRWAEIIKVAQMRFPDRDPEK